MSLSNQSEWTRLLGASETDRGNALTTGSDGSIYIAGTTFGDLDGQDSERTGYQGDAFICKYKPDGTKEWTRLLGSSFSDYGSALTTGSDGSIYFAGEITNGTSSLIGNQSDAFISKYNPDGTEEWTKLIGFSSASDGGNALTTGSDGSIYIVGFTEVIAMVDPIFQSYNEFFIRKYNPDGTEEWTRQLEIDAINALTTGSDGSIYIAGYNWGDLDGQTSSGLNDAFLSKYSPDGTKEWTRLFGTTGTEKGNALTTGSDGSIYIAGFTSGDLDGQINSGFNDGFLSKYSPDGTKEWTRHLGTTKIDQGNALTTGNDGSIYIAGDTYGDLDGQNNSGRNDAFISKYDPDGTKEWTRLLGTSTNDEGNALTTGSDGSIYIAGSTSGGLDGQTNNGNQDAFLSKITNLFNPTDISLSSTSFNENIDAASTVATLSTTDADASDSHTYTLISGTGDTDNASFTIEGSNLKISSSPDYETQSSYYIRIKTTDSGGLSYQEAITLSVNDLIDETPTDISLSSTSFNENIDAASTVATLSTTDADASDSHTYTLISGTGDTDNASFTIEGSNLKISSSPDYETKSSYSVRIKTTDSDDLTYEEAVTFSVNDLIDTGTKVADINESYTTHSKGFSSISGSAPITVTAYEIGQETTLDSIKDYDGNLHAGDDLEATASSYKYQGLLDVNGDAVFEGIFTNKVSRRWVTAKVDSVTGQVDFDDHGSGGGTRVVGIYEDPLIAEGASNGGFLSDQVTPAPAAIGATGSDRYIDLNGDGDFDDANEDRLALNSQVRFQNDLDIDNLSAKHSGDYDGDGIHEVYWKTNDGTAYLRSLMHADGNIRYANYQSEIQMRQYLVSQGHKEIISDIV